MYTGKAPWEVCFENVRAVGPERCLLSSDLGQTINPPVAQGLPSFAQRFLEARLSPEEVRAMSGDQRRAASEGRRVLSRYEVPARSGVAFELDCGSRVRVIDREAKQVADLVCFARGDSHEHLSAGRTTDYNEKLLLSTGDVLYSDRSRAMLTIEDDRVGGHSLLYAPCSPEMFRMTYGITEPLPTCLGNFVATLEPHGIESWAIPNPFNIFLNTELSSDGVIKVRPARSRAGHFIDMRAQMDLLVAVTACSALTCNDGSPTAIDVEVESPRGGGP